MSVARFDRQLKDSLRTGTYRDAAASVDKLAHMNAAYADMVAATGSFDGSFGRAATRFNAARERADYGGGEGGMSLLATLGLTADAIAARKSSIGGSDANTIMSGNADRIIRLWREKRGEVEGEDLSDNLAVQMGSFTEPLNVAWFEKQTGLRVTRRGEVARLDTAGFPMAATLDGIATSPDDYDTRAVFEAKHCGTRNTDAELFARYVPQLTHNCLCADADRAWLSVFKGNGDWCVFEYALDAAYAERLIDAERAFWTCVQSGEPPAPLPPVPTPKPVGVVEYDMGMSNAWVSFAADFTETLLAADRHDKAKSALKELVPADASKAFGAGIEIRRDKRGSLRFY